MLPNYPELDPEALRRAMRRWATGVTIVTASHAGVRHGMTVSSFTSVSLEPPLVLVTIQRSTRTHDLIAGAGGFGVSILGRSHREISDRFAGLLTEDEDRFAGLEVFSLKSAAPFISGCLAAFDCRVVQTYPAGTNTLFIGQVEATYAGPSQEAPLLYYDRQYRGLV